MRILLFVLCLIFSISSFGSKNWLANYQYPYPLHYYHFTQQNQKLKLAYMDIKPKTANHQTVLLLHGKNFIGAYWKDVIQALTDQGYRVIVPDVLGFGKSSHPTNFYYTFQAQATDIKLLLDSLGIQKINLIGHSMNGMLAVRFSLMFPNTVNKLVLEDPLGLEDYKILIPFIPVETLYQAEISKTPEQVVKYQKTYFVHWKEQYAQWGQLQAETLTAKDSKQRAWVSALLYEMIYTQPVRYEYKNIQAPTLFIVGAEDRTAPFKATVPKEIQEQLGKFPELAKQAASELPNGCYTIIPESGHIPHFEQFDLFMKHVLQFFDDGCFNPSTQNTPSLIANANP